MLSKTLMMQTLQKCIQKRSTHIKAFQSIINKVSMKRYFGAMYNVYKVINMLEILPGKKVIKKIKISKPENPGYYENDLQYSSYKKAQFSSNILANKTFCVVKTVDEQRHCRKLKDGITSIT